MLFLPFCLGEPEGEPGRDVGLERAIASTTSLFFFLYCSASATTVGTTSRQSPS